MVQLNVIGLISIVYAALSVAGASISNLEFQARSAELSKLIEARNLAYSTYQTHDSTINERAEEMRARGFSTEHLLYRRMDSKFKESILDWLAVASTRGAAQFGENTWAKMHSGGTSDPPNCRPYGMRKKVMVDGEKKGNKKTKIEQMQYYVRMECAPDPKKPDSKVEVVGTYVAGNTNAPTTEAVYAQLKAKVQAL